MTYKKPEDIEMCVECPLFRFDLDNPKIDDPKTGIKGCNHMNGPGDFIDFNKYSTEVHPDCPLPIQWKVFLGKIPRNYLSKIALAAGNSCLDVHMDTAASYDKDIDDLEIKEDEIAVYARKSKNISDEEFDIIKYEFYGKFLDFSGVTFSSLLLKEKG